MRIPSGVTDQYIYFVAVDATDLSTRETGLATFTVYRSRDGAAAAAYTTPTVNETDSTNMPGVYELLLDEDMTITAGNDSEEVCLHITATGMAPVTRVFELYRPKVTAGNTLDVTATGAAGIDWGNIENKTTANDLSGTDIQLCDTITTYTGNTVQTGDNYARIGAPAGASVSADVAAVKTQTAAIETDTQDLQTQVGTAGAGLSNIGTIATCTTVTNEVTADITKISGSATAADNLESSALGIVPGLCEATPSTTVIQTDLAEATDDHYIGRIVVFTSGAAAGQASDITDYTGATGTITVTALTTAPAASDAFVIV